MAAIAVAAAGLAAGAGAAGVTAAAAVVDATAGTVAVMAAGIVAEEEGTNFLATDQRGFTRIKQGPD